MFYLNIFETSVKVSDIAMALSHLYNCPLPEAIKQIKDFHKDMKSFESLNGLMNFNSYWFIQ